MSLGLMKLLVAFEGYKNSPYRDPVGNWTIGVGHLMTSNDKNLACIGVPEGESYFEQNPLTDLQVFVLLVLDIAERIPDLQSVVGKDLPIPKQDALMSFLFNLGIGNLKKSTLVKYIQEGKNDSDIGLQFLRWNLAGGHVLPGLVMRRAVESSIYQGFTTIPPSYVSGISTSEQQRAQRILDAYNGK